MAVSLNLKSAEGLAIFRRLAVSADVVVENFRPGVKVKLGVDYAAVPFGALGLTHRISVNIKFGPSESHPVLQTSSLIVPNDLLVHPEQ